MWNFIIRRLFLSVVVLIVISFLSYALMALMPGDPVQEMLASNPRMRVEDVERLRKLYGLDLPIYERYYNWLSDTLRGDLGYSRTYKVPVTEIMGERIANTAVLSVSALLLSLLLAVPIGIISALRNGTRFDYVANLISFAGQSLPPFWLGIMLIMVFAEWLQLLPAGGTMTIGTELTGIEFILDRLRYISLPVLVFTISQMAVYVRFTRGAMIEVMRQDYIRTARAKGLGERRVVTVHAFRNALIPLVTIVAIAMGNVFGGAIITEQVFAYQGVGKLVYEAIIGNDFRVAMVAFNLTIAAVLIMNLIADISYAFLDPRIAYK
jgi:peptide/nickel transport system permease protein